MFTAPGTSYTSTSAWAIILFGCLVAAAYDVQSRRIPNWLTGSLLLGGVIWSASFGGIAGFGNALAACVLLALPFLVLFVFAGGGAADAKLMGAIGAWVGVRHGLVVLIAVLVAGTILGVVYAVIKRRMQSVLINLSLTGFGLANFVTRRKSWSQAAELMPVEHDLLPMPYGLSIFVGVVMAACSSMIWKQGFLG
jgi:prepilin peptidase CpaA